MLSRRGFLQTGSAATALLAFRRRAYAFQQSPILTKFRIRLPGLGPAAANEIGQFIPVAVPQKLAGLDAYKIVAQQYTEQVHPNLGPTTFWGYADATTGTPVNGYLGPVIVAQKGQPVRITLTNGLAGKTHPLPVDTTIMGAELGQADNRITLHLHGGLTPWTSDGGPFSWFAPDGTHGASFLNGTGVNGQAAYFYPNDQSARLMWYHDHAFGTTRLNAYAGLASAYILRDPLEQQLISLGLIPAAEIPLVIQDKTFQPSGLLWYPTEYEKNSLPNGFGRWDYGPDANPPATVTGPLPNPSAVPEYFSDTIVVNGAVYPYVQVQPQRYRFRILNGSNARFYNLQLYYESTTVPGEADLTKAGPAFLQIGTEGGFLLAPAVLNNPPQQIGFDTNPASPTFGNVNRYNLLLAPAERADVIIDFSGVAPGARLILYNDAPAPFPGGDSRNDYFTGDTDQQSTGGAASTLPGQGPNTRTLLQFRVVPGLRAASAVSGANLGPYLAQAASKLGNTVRVRDLTLNEDFDELGRLIQKLGTNKQNGLNSQGQATWGRNYLDPTTENPKAGDVEIWRIFNLTGDTHPIHFHLVNVQILARQPFDAAHYNGTPVFTGPFRGPDANELGWKETVRANPNEMIMVIMKFDLPKTPFPVPLSPRTGGYEYVWHCHILEHEEHDMMRPLVVTP